MTSLHLGLDAGNSKTLAVVATSDGLILGRGRAGAGDIYAAGGVTAAAEAVRSAVDEALAAAGVGAADLRNAAFRLAGVDWPEDGAHWRGTIHAAWPGLGQVSVKNDGFALLRLGDLGSEGGVSVVLGTGGAMAARGPDGAEASLSFWSQDPLGALGLGHAAFRVVIRAELGIDPPTVLGERLAARFGRADVQELLHAFTRRERPRPEEHKAAASRTVLEAAAEGDAAAIRVVQDQATTVVDHVAALGRRVGVRPESAFAIPLGGSLVTSGEPVLRETLLAAIRAAFPSARVQGLTASPVIGAVLDALAEAGTTPTPKALARLTGAGHPDGFFTT